MLHINKERMPEGQISLDMQTGLILTNEIQPPYNIMAMANSVVECVCNGINTFLQHVRVEMCG